MLVLSRCEHVSYAFEEAWWRAGRGALGKGGTRGFGRCIFEGWFWGHGVGALAARRGEFQVRVGAQAQGTTHSELRTGWRTQRRRFRGAALWGRLIFWEPSQNHSVLARVSPRDAGCDAVNACLLIGYMYARTASVFRALRRSERAAWCQNATKISWGCTRYYGIDASTV
jgi:hypothetical protein